MGDKMIMVTEVKLIEVDGPTLECAHLHEPMRGIMRIEPNGRLEPIPVYKETVRGRQFVNSRGERVVLGMTEAVQKAIGLPFQAYENLRREVEDLQKDRKEAWNKVYEYSGRERKMQALTFWGRLKWVITGKV